MYNLYTEPKCTALRCPYMSICDQVPTKTFQSEMREQSSPMDFLFLIEYPTWKESQMRNFWISSVGRVITKVMAKNYPDKTYSISAAVRAWPYKAEKLPAPQYNGSKASLIPEYILQKTPTAPVHTHPYYHEILKTCAPHWQNDIEYWKPKTIVVMGNVALHAMFPKEQRSILELADETLYYKDTPVRFVTSSHFILHKPSLKETWVQKFKRTLDGRKQAHFDYKLINIDLKDQYKDVSGVRFWELVTTAARAKEVLSKLASDRKPVSIDTETLNLNKKHGAVLGMVQVGNTPDMIYAIPWIHYETPFDANDMREMVPVFKEFLESSDIPIWYTWNGKFEKNILENTFQASMASRIYDGVVGEFLLDDNRLERASEYKYGIYTLKQIALDRLGFDGWDQNVLKFRGEGSLMDLPLLKIAEYGCLDVGLTQLACENQIAEAEATNYENFMPLMFGLIDPIIRVFSQVERDGFPASREHVRSLISRESPLIAVIRDTMAWVQATPEGQRANKIILDKSTRVGAQGITPLARTPMILDFSKQNHPQTLFFDVMGLEPIEISETGTRSVDGEFQEAYKSNPIVAKFSEWVEARKMFDSFAKQLYDYLDPSGPHMDCKTDQRVRPNYKLSGVVTGRIACNEPNLQAIPRSETDVKKWIKNIFQVNKKGRVLVQLDYKANEMRWVGIAAKDLAMAKKFNGGKEALDRYRTTLDPEDFKLATLLGDVHKQNASAAFKVPIDQVTKDLRQKAKGCLRKGTLVNTKRGLVKVEEVEVGDYVWTGTNWTVVNDLYRPEQHIYRIEMERGIYVDVSEDHEIEVIEKETYNKKFVFVTELDLDKHLVAINRKQPDYSNVVDLSKFDITEKNPAYINISKSHGTFPVSFPKEMDESLAWLLGAMIAEGGSLQNSTKNTMTFSQAKSDKYFDEFGVKYAELFGIEASYSERLARNCEEAALDLKNHKLSAYVGQFLKYCGFIGGAANKEVPWSILQSNKKCQIAFIRGYMDGDGSAPTKGVRCVKASSASEILAKQMRVMLLNLGIFCSQSVESRKLPNKDEWRDYYIFSAFGSEYDRYFSIIGETHNLKHRSTSRRHQKEVVHGVMGILKREIKTKIPRFNIHDNQHVITELGYMELEKNWPRYKAALRDLNQEEYIRKFQEIIENRPFISKVKEVRKISEPEQVYDLVLPKPDIWFMAEGIIHFDCSFGVLYDSSEASVAELYGMTVEETKKMFAGFYAEHHAIYGWKMEMKEMARQKGYVEAPHGRRRRFPIFDLYRNEQGWYDDNLVPREHRSMIADALRQSSNSPIQGIASDAANIGAYNLLRYIKKNRKDWLMCNIVHDSAVVEINFQDLDEYVEVSEPLFTTDVMEYMDSLWGIDFILPLEIDYDFGIMWGHMEAWDFSPTGLATIKENLAKLV